MQSLGTRVLLHSKSSPAHIDNAAVARRAARSKLGAGGGAHVPGGGASQTEGGGEVALEHRRKLVSIAIVSKAIVRIAVR